MNAVMVVHGPAAFDAGDVERLMGLLRPRRVLVAGVMARTAAEESGLPVTCTDERPSRVLSNLREPAFLLNRGKTPVSGRIFGEIVAGRLPGLVHVETSSGTVYCWNRGDAALAEEIALRTGCDLVLARSTAKPQDGLREIRGCDPRGGGLCQRDGHRDGNRGYGRPRDGEWLAEGGLRSRPQTPRV